MASAAQIEANRKNAQKSTGPVTPAGKAKSSRNSIRHGLLSRVIPIDAPGYRELLDGLYTSLTPQNELQRMMVDQIAITSMRLRRIWGAEQNYLYTKSGDWQNGPDANSATVHSYLEVPTAVTYLRYESMLNRLLARLLRQYHAIRSDASWADISRSDSPYIQEQAAERPAEEARTEQQVAAAEVRCTESDSPPKTERERAQTLRDANEHEIGIDSPRIGGRGASGTDSPTIGREFSLRDRSEEREGAQSDTEARMAALAKIPYNEFAVQSRVAAYDARQSLYGAG